MVDLDMVDLDMVDLDMVDLAARSPVMDRLVTVVIRAMELPLTDTMVHTRPMAINSHSTGLRLCRDLGTPPQSVHESSRLSTVPCV